ncbi:hypothetical protein P153DRAFT_338350 [Dothidotthia symphoricarpi CBS 119687]|uniref:Zn(2)-C6 fungal-type domain-containing protein n=1 Tax=Dothidotthia symphoricarpi CBS 119687 TaxID=1392245 RepID=A0A6A6AG02_9PLEO|nr:uncharacterized protein P153DRAFT_338350 [Dothidotthia symphoricarpi CBS 119687]KAF2130496.1 hypothetical protein P153DRAFT_338350 [Dothidotthia symphoricarpi CBS 119687]
MTHQRASAACDACRARKVKCHLTTSETKCSACIELNIDCTSVHPRKKRGPKNRYVQALRAELDGKSEQKSYGLEIIAPFPTVQQLIADWFGWIHPVAPILHPDRFLEQVAETHDSASEVSPSFLLLVTSLCAATFASLRRRRHLYAPVTVDSCLDLAERLGLWQPSNTITLERSLTIYNFSSAAHHERGIDSALSHRLFAEAAMSVTYLTYQKSTEMSFMEQQILKRLYWLVYAGQCTCDMHGRRLLVLRHAHEEVGSLLPLEISDEQLVHWCDADHIDDACRSQSFVPGLNVLSKLFLVWQSSQAIPAQTMANLQEHISRANSALADLPPKLSWTGETAQSGDFGFDVQKVNLKVTQLHIRANLLEQMNTLAKAQSLLITPNAIIEERHRVVDELLDILYHMPTEVFDANGYSIVPKIRDIGGALLDELRTGSHGRTLQASMNLDRLLAKLENLDLRPMAQTPYI